MANARKTDTQIQEFIWEQERKLLYKFYKDGFDFLRPRKSFRKFNQIKVPGIWDSVVKARFFGEELSGDTLERWRHVRGIYKAESMGEVLPLNQAIRLLDVYRLQNKQMVIVEARMRELNLLHKSLLEKLEQLLALGENNAEGHRNLEHINADYNALEEIRNGLKGSCHRLAMTLISAQKAAQSRKIRHELGDISSQLPRAATAVESAFEAQSLEDIERQIGREIETYLQLERETDEHLR